MFMAPRILWFSMQIVLYRISDDNDGNNADDDDDNHVIEMW